MSDICSIRPMAIGHTVVRVDVAAGTGLALLMRLSAASRGPRDDLPPDLANALEAVGDTEGETWLNLLGVGLDAGAPYDRRKLLDAFRTIDGVELRRHLLGRFAWSWCTLAGIDDIEAAAAGDRAAAARLLEHPRYYGGHATASLATLLPLDPDETQARLVHAVEAARELACGYRYVPEVEADRVVLVPHLESGLPLVLAQHRSARLIAYFADLEQGDTERLTALGKALSDPKRVEILALVGRGLERAGELVEASGLTRSTVHHHLAQLRAAGLVALEGNARAYTYVPRHDAPAEVAALVAAVVGRKEDQ
jgi:DNA-binding transcriptional ArsR family regulator